MNNTVLTCVYCGHKYPNGTPAAKHELLTSHIKICEKHPLREAEKTIFKLRSALVGMVGADSVEELNAMEILIRSAPAPASDMIVAVNAIDVLRETLEVVDE